MPTGIELFDHMRGIAADDCTFVQAGWNQGEKFNYPWESFGIQIDFQPLTGDGYGVRYPDKLMPDVADKVTLGNGMWKAISKDDLIIILDDALEMFGQPEFFERQ